MKGAFRSIYRLLFVSFFSVRGFFRRSFQPKKFPLALSNQLPSACRNVLFEGVWYIVCEVDLFHYQPEIRFLDSSGKPYGNLSKLAQEETLCFSMNAGIYHKHSLIPVGLCVEKGCEISPVNMDEGEGNFFMKPNGIFHFHPEYGARVTETGCFSLSSPPVECAIQSGPMLVINGQIHPLFSPNGVSRYIRNGIGVSDSQTVFLAISYEPVSFGSFARLFRHNLGCLNALYLDGDISSFHTGSAYLIGGGDPVGPIFIARKRAVSRGQ